MNKELLKNISRIVVHKNCPDGLASAIILQDVLPSATIEFVLHNTAAYDNLEATEGMIFCDIIPPPMRIDDFIKVNPIVLDHHLSAKEIVKKFGLNGVYADEFKEPGVSGAVLAFREVWEPLQDNSCNSWETVEYFATLAGVVDTWQTQSELWFEANHQSSILMFYSPEHWLDGHPLSSFPNYEDYNFGKILYNRRINKAKKIANSCYRFNCKNYSIAIFNDSDKITSDVANILKSEGVNIVAGFYFVEIDDDTQMPKIIYSLRSDGDIDVSEVAKWINPLGGGHSCAAGVPLTVDNTTINPFSLFKEKIINYINEMGI